MFSFFKRKNKSAGSEGSATPTGRNIAQQNALFAEAFANGCVPCQQCSFQIPMKGLQQLRMVECPMCKAVTFVPMQVGRFWLFEPLGGGGMGSVYRALNPEALDRHFAVKVLSRVEKTKPANIHALLNEARIGKLIGDHPCLVKCVDSGCQNGEYYSAMELVEGERLDKRIDRLGRLPEQQVLQIGLHILAAEQHIFKCGYLYRDLKPENIIINNEGYAILFDYGLCMPREDALHPKDEFVSGSPYYLPPERLLGKGEDASSEIYSLSMVIYYALSGTTYFDADEVEALAKRHVSKVRLSVSSKLRGFDEDFVALLTKMVRQEPEERFQSFHEVARAIRAIQDSSQ